MTINEVRENGGRKAILMSNDRFRTVIDYDKGMVPELSARRGSGWINSHWSPWFRSNSGERWNASRHSDFWKVPLLYDIAGNFPCIPNFGPDHEVNGRLLPPHGITAAETWTHAEASVAAIGSAAVFKTSLKSSLHPFEYRKTDLAAEDHNVLYTALDILNTGTDPEPYNYAWHNTVGAPYLESGCIIDNSAEAFAVPPEGGEFDHTGRLAFGAETDSLKKVPLRNGGTADLREVPGITGYTDFISGAVPGSSHLAWSSVVNPSLKMVYLSFFTGPAAAGKGELPLYFHDLWMNYGGRSYRPWAAEDGATDMTFCLGAENATGWFANGLKSSIEHPVLMGNPTHQVLEPADSRRLYYGTFFGTYEGGSLDSGVKNIEREDGFLVLIGYSGMSSKLKADWNFSLLKSSC